MYRRHLTTISYTVMLMLALLVFGCAGTVKNMQPVPPERIMSAPESGKSLVVFLRPSGMGFAIQSSVFEIKEDTPVLAGIVAAKKKVAYQTEPGQHLFMVIGESADFMSADLAPNKVYYALVTPRMGAWKARFSLKPMHAEDLKGPKFAQWLAGCEWVEMTPASKEWAATHMDSIVSKQKSYYQKWMAKDPGARPRLLPADSR